MAKIKGDVFKDKRDMPTIKDGMSRHHKHNNKKEEERQKYDDVVQIEVSGDFSKYRGMMNLGNKLSKQGADRDYIVQMLDDCLEWLRDKDGEGNDVLILQDIISYLGIPSSTWWNWGKYDKRIVERQEIIKELLMSRVHYRGAKSQINPVFAMFSLKNSNPHLFKDKQEVEQTNTLKIERINVTGVEDDTKRLDSAEVKEIEEHDDSE